MTSDCDPAATRSHRKLHAQAVLWQRAGDETVAQDIGASRYFALNGAGAQLWEVLTEGAPPERLAGILVTNHGASEDVAQRNVTTFLAALEQHGLLEEEPSS